MSTECSAVDYVRTTTKFVADHAAHVSIRAEGVAALAAELVRRSPERASLLRVGLLTLRC